MTLVQSSPTTIYELDLNWFRLELRDLEDEVEGMPFVRTHKHNTEVSLGGITYARVIEIINDYTVTFEDDQYAVNLVGANSNVGDVVNVNQVSVRSQNSAGLISSPDIEYASFNGGVTVDVNSGNSGTVFPRGTERMKVDNLADAYLIATYRGFNKIYVHSDLTISGTEDWSNFVFVGRNHIQTDITIDASASVSGITIEQCNVSNSTLDGENVLSECVVGTLDYLNGHIHDCSLNGTITLGGGQDAYFDDCTQLDFHVNPGVDMGGSGQDLVMTNYVGIVEISNLNSSGNAAGIGLQGGRVVLEDTVVSGTVHVSGIGHLVDSNGDAIISGTWNGGVTIINELIDSYNLEVIRRMVYNNVDVSGDVATIYEEDGVTVWKQFNLANDGRLQL